MLLTTIVLIFSATDSVTSLDLRFRSDTIVSPAQWGHFFNGFPQLTTLHVNVRSCRNLFRVLRANINFCPALKVFSVAHENGSGVHELIVSTIEGRASRGLRLDTFRLFQLKEGDRDTPLSDSRIERLKQHVGQLEIH